MSDDSQDRLPPIVMGVPGPWKDQDELAERVRVSSAGVFEVYAEDDGAILGDRQLLRASGLEVNPRQPGLEMMVGKMGRGRMGRRAIETIGRHQSIAVLYGEGGSLANARAMIRAAAALLHAGGSAVIIESTGVAHAPEDFLKLAGDTDGDAPGGLFWAFTIVTPGRLKRGFYSCGMHNLGLRDAICESLDEIEPAAFLLLNFLGYVYEADPTVADGDAVGAEGVPFFRVYREPCDLHDASDPFFNPYGMWRIRMLDDRAIKSVEVRHPFLKKLPTHPGETRA